MNAAELNTEITKLLSRAWEEGLVKGKMSPCEVIGLLQMHATDFHANVKIAQANAARQAKAIILPEFRPRGPHRAE